MPLIDLPVLLLLADATDTAKTTPADWHSLRDVALNLGGWATILWSLALAALRRLDQFGNHVTKRLDTVARETRALRKDIRLARRRMHRTHARQRHDPPSTPPPPPTTPPPGG